MGLLTEEIKRRLPKLYATEKQGGAAIVQCKFFAPWNQWTMYAIEFDGTDTFFGLIVGDEVEMGYFSLSEMKSVRGPFGLEIERDLYFTPKTLAEIRAKHGR